MLLRRITFTILLLASSVSLASFSANEVTTSADSNWFFGGFSLAVADAQNYSQGGTGFFAYNYATINYRIANKRHVSFRIPFTYRSAGYDSFGEKNQDQQVMIDDVIFDVTDSATLLPGDVEMFSRFRYEAPTGKYSIAQKTLGSLRLDLIFSKHLARNFQMEYWPIMRWNMHTQTTYMNPDTDSLSHTKRYELDQRVNFWYVPTARLGIGAFIGTEDTWFNESDLNDTSRQRNGRLAEHAIKVGPAVGYRFTESLRFVFNVSNLVPLWGYSPDRTGSTSDLGKFKPEQTQFVLLTFMNF